MSTNMRAQFCQAVQVVLRHPWMWLFGCLIGLTRGSSSIRFSSLDVALLSGTFGLLLVALAAFGRVVVINSARCNGQLSFKGHQNALKAVGNVFLLRVLIPHPQLVLATLLPLLFGYTSSPVWARWWLALVFLAVILSAPLSFISAAYAFAEMSIVVHGANSFQGFNAGFQVLRQHLGEGMMVGYLSLMGSVLGLPLTFGLIALNDSVMAALHVNGSALHTLSFSDTVILLSLVFLLCNGVIEAWMVTGTTYLYDVLQ